MMDQSAKRYLRQTTLPELGQSGQRKLGEARVLVIGAGGLSCPALTYLAAAGIGHITVMDADKVELTNLHRQVLYDDVDQGRFKVDVAAEKLMLQNPDVSVTPLSVRFDPDNALTLVAQHDVVLDGSDNFSTRYLVNDACVIKDKPLVHGSISRFQGQVSVFNFEGGPTYRCLFPEPPENMPTCAEEGVLGVLPGLIGSIQALEVIKVITGIGETLSGKLLLVDTATMNFNTVKFSAVPENQQLNQLQDDYMVDCSLTAYRISFDEAVRLQEEGTQIHWIDVRDNPTETGLSPVIQANELPVIAELSKALVGQPVLVCATGLSADRLSNELKQTHGIELPSLAGGLTSVDSERLKS